ncbi:hypothetical protein GCM10025868_13760 [Angustibacter aerolatus]|uniref:Uncharacterized protein n=1 Tax=Angustibacter aerolatus TaxID=1162965 RepID=A0ABQ6JD61_9ACTN|nr:hypothetical protein [Angustibacter aerolatus]GMA86126.1 hypothetical protein GCM10025868_13760 [Angustibacter aerolatus]
MPRDVGTAVKVALRTLEQGSRGWNARFKGDVAPAMFSGVSTHAIMPPRGLAPAAAGLMLASLAHGVGWPIPRGGSQVLVDVVADLVRRHGGSIRTGVRVSSLAEPPPARVVFFDTSVRGVVQIAGDRLPVRYRDALGRFEFGHAAAKVDFALSGPVPWQAEHLDLAGTLHVGASREEMMVTEREVAQGRVPDHPYVLASQPSILDDTRAPAGQGCCGPTRTCPTAAPSTSASG